MSYLSIVTSIRDHSPVLDARSRMVWFRWCETEAGNDYVMLTLFLPWFHFALSLCSPLRTQYSPRISMILRLSWDGIELKFCVSRRSIPALCCLALLTKSFPSTFSCNLTKEPGTGKPSSSDYSFNTSVIISWLVDSVKEVSTCLRTDALVSPIFYLLKDWIYSLSLRVKFEPR